MNEQTKRVLKAMGYDPTEENYARAKRIWDLTQTRLKVSSPPVDEDSNTDPSND